MTLHISSFLKSLIGKLLYKFISLDNKSVFLYPHPNCKADNADVIRYHSDNVLCLFNYIIRQASIYDNYQYYVVIFDREKRKDYIQYVKGLNPRTKVEFVYYKDRMALQFAARCSYYFTSTMSPSVVYYKKPKQIVVDLGYFVPFKNLYLSEKQQRDKAFEKNSIFDYVIQTADLPARTMALSFSVPLENVLSLGFCRNDVFYSPKVNMAKRLELELGYEIKRIIVFTPTWRNYETRTGRDNIVQRDLFGYERMDYCRLDDILERNKAVIIAKLHPLQQNIDNTKSFRRRIIPFEVIKKLGFDLYRLLNETDCLITDYTSAYIDFLHADKPIIFNFNDLDLYDKTRGFSYNPIELFCAGDIVTNSVEMTNAIESVLLGNDKYKAKRADMRHLFDSHLDGDNAKRVAEYFLK